MNGDTDKQDENEDIILEDCPWPVQNNISKAILPQIANKLETLTREPVETITK